MRPQQPLLLTQAPGTTRNVCEAAHLVPPDRARLVIRIGGMEVDQGDEAERGRFLHEPHDQAERQQPEKGPADDPDAVRSREHVAVHGKLEQLSIGQAHHIVGFRLGSRAVRGQAGVVDKSRFCEYGIRPGGPVVDGKVRRPEANHRLSAGRLQRILGPTEIVQELVPVQRVDILMLITVAGDFMPLRNQLAHEVGLIPGHLPGGEACEPRVALGLAQQGEDAGDAPPGLIRIGARLQPHVEHGGVFVVFQIDRQVTMSGCNYHTFPTTRNCLERGTCSYNVVGSYGPMGSFLRQKHH